MKPCSIFLQRNGTYFLNKPRTYNVTMKRVRVTIYAVEIWYVLNNTSRCIYSRLSYPACKAHVPYYIAICGLLAPILFPRYLKNGTTFGKML